MINITIENTILKAENKGFKNALYYKKKRRKYSKPVFNFRNKDSKGITFYSPTKIK